MNKEDYLQSIDENDINPEKLSKIYEIYSEYLPEILKSIISNNDESIFFEDGSRILSYDEILNAENDLHVQFKNKGIIPVADCGENDFIIYDFKNRVWAKFNIIDETIFKKRSSLDELL